MPRPKHLPNFSEPPLEEVVFGVQFSPVPGYTTVDAAAVWELFRSEFPVVEEHPQIPPQFETFGGAHRPGVQFQFGPAMGTNRLWFVSGDGSHLLQFQPDRFLTNWRKHIGLVPYPRFEQIVSAFEKHLGSLGEHLLEAKDYTIDINQCEITYTNIIPVSDFSEYHKWVKVVSPLRFPVEVLATTLVEVIKDKNGSPVARLFHDFQAVMALDGKSKALRLQMTYRGKPEGSGVDSALVFLAKGREAIVSRFAELTTKRAHDAWKRSA